MNAFIAWTPLHVINIINTALTYHPEDRNDIYIYDEFTGADEVYENLMKTQVFTNVYRVSYQATGNILRKGLSLLFNNQNFVKHDAVYENIFIQGGNYFSKILYGEIKKHNPNLHLHYIEDGLGAYIGSPIIRLDTPAKKIVKKLNKYSMYHADVESYYIYEPRLISDSENIHFFKLPKLDNDNLALDAIKKVFSLDDKSDKYKLADQILYFDQPFIADGFAINEISLMNQILQMNRKQSVIVKFHPRSSRDKYGAISSLDTTLPWELFCLNLEMENVILLSVATTGSFTPYLMFNIEMPVVMLASLYLKTLSRTKENMKTINMLENVITFAQVYKEKTGAIIHMPNSLEELEDILNKKVLE